MMGVRTEDEIVTLPAPREILLRVINDVVCAKRSRDVQIPGAAHGSDFGSEQFGNLKREGTHSTGGSINQNFLAWLDLSFVAKALKGSERRDGYSGCVLKRTVGGLQRHFIFKSADILGKASAPETRYAEHLVAGLKLPYVFADCFYSPCDITAEDLVFWRALPREGAEQRRTSHHEQVQWIYGCRAKLDQDFAIGGRGFCYLRELQNIRGAVLRACDRFHKVLFESDSVGSCCVVEAHDKRG
jgi:hypothetical protein